MNLQNKWKKHLLAFGFFNDLAFFYPFYNSMFFHFNMTQIQIASLLIALQVGKMAFDLPSGFFADIIGRKIPLILSPMLKAAFLIIWISSKNIISFQIGMIVYGISMSLLAGNIEAYIYDMIMDEEKKNQNQNKDINEKKDEFAKTLGYFYSMRTIGIAIASYTGGMIFKNDNYNTILFISTISATIATVYAMFMPKYNVINKQNKKTAINEQFKQIKHKIIDSNILYSMFALTFNDAMFYFLIDLNTITMHNFNISNKNIAIIAGCVSAVKIIPNAIAGHLVHIFSIPKIIIINTMLFVSIIIGLKYNNQYVVITSISALLTFCSFSDVKINTTYQKFLSKETRTIFLSSSGVLTAIQIIAFNSITGILTDKKGHLYGLTIVSMVIISIMVLGYRKGQKIEQTIKQNNM